MEWYIHRRATGFWTFEIEQWKRCFCAARELCCLPERKWMSHISCLWTQISKRLPYLGTPHGSRDRETVSFSSFPQPEQTDSEQYQISSFPETFQTPKQAEIEMKIPFSFLQWFFKHSKALVFRGNFQWGRSLSKRLSINTIPLGY